MAEQSDAGSAAPGAQSGGGKQAVEPERSYTYHVFEAPSDELKPGDKLTLVATVEGVGNKKDARWKAVERDSALGEKVLFAEGGPPKKGAYLVAVAERNAVPEHTIEEAVVERKRR